MHKNAEEARIGSDSYFSSTVTQTYKSGNNDEWIEAELATKLKPTRFKELTGADINDVQYYLRNREDENNGRRSMFHIEPAKMEIMGENQWVQDILELMLNYQLKSGDLGRLSSYGEVNREGHPSVVVTDYGFTDEVYADHYAPKPQKVNYR